MSFKLNSEPSAIRISGLSYSYRKTAPPWILDGIDLQLTPGDYTLLCGSSGSGKSTLCRTLNGLIPHFHRGTFKGSVHLGSLSTRDRSVGDLLVDVGLVFQNPEAQLFNRTVALELAYGMESLGYAPSAIRGRIKKIAGWLEIESLLDRNPHHLSGGEQHLVAIGILTALQPGWLVLDEPYANLDSVNVGRVRAALRSAHEMGFGIVVSEHRLTPTVPDSDRMVVLHDGTIKANAAPRAVLGKEVLQWGLEAPLAVRVGAALGITPVPLKHDELMAQIEDCRAISSFRPPTAPPISGSAAPALEVAGLDFTLDDQVLLDDINFTLYQGECLAVVGANGAGKTTLLKHLNGLYRPTQGSVRVGDADSRRRKVSQMARHVGIAFQNPNSQFFKLTVREEIQIGARVMDCYDEDWFSQLVVLFGLEALLDRSPHRLSAGEKKRVAFAAALAAKPDVLALDEPTAGQDGHFREALGRLLAQLRDRGQAVILATHDLTFAEQHAHRWLVLSGGKQLMIAPPDQVMADGAIMTKAHLAPTDAFRLFHPAVTGPAV